MESLLKWSIDAAHSGTVDSNPDPKMLAQLLGAPDDITLMREELRAAVESKDKGERIECLQAFEEHVENVDNANNMGTLWEPLLHLVSDEDADIRAHALSCVGAAVQNNSKSQADFVATKNGMRILMDRVNDYDENVSSKALLAISSAIAHCEPAYEQFVEARGWEVFERAFESSFDSSDDRPEKIRSRVLSLLFSIVLLAPRRDVHDEVERLQLIPKLEKLEDQECGVVKDKIQNILTTLKENPKTETKLISQ